MSRFRKHDIVRIKNGWWDGGKTGIVIGPDVFTVQSWTPLVWFEESDPEFHKSVGLEVIRRATRDEIRTVTQG